MCLTPVSLLLWQLFARQHITEDLMFLEPSAGNNQQTWIMQLQFFLRCQHQHSAALCSLITHLKTLILQVNPLLPHLCMASNWTTTASQMASLKSQRRHTHLANHELLTKLRESHQLAYWLSWYKLKWQVHTMSWRKADSLPQKDIFGGQGIHYMASQSTTCKTIEDLFHDSHL